MEKMFCEYLNVEQILSYQYYYGGDEVHEEPCYIVRISHFDMVNVNLSDLFVFLYNRSSKN
jgi:hypothetical protein